MSCAILLWKHGRITALHPGAIYLVFHVLFVTVRACSVLAGSNTLFTAWRPGIVPISEAEVAWAVNLADLALISMTAAWIKAAADHRRRHTSTLGVAPRPPRSAMLSQKVIQYVGAVAFPIGLAALASFAYLPSAGDNASTVDLGSWNYSSWTVITQSWSGLVLLSLIYYYGFRKVFVIPLYVYLLIMAAQGSDRFRVIVPLIYLFLVWLFRRGAKWPPLWMAGAGLVIALSSFPLKSIGWMIQNGGSFSDVIEVATNSVTDVINGRSADQLILDEFACTVSLVDESHRYYYGTLYYPLFTLPIPRQWWPDKPAINTYQYELSTPSRPMATSGMVPTLQGESYANLGIVGIVIISFVAAYWLGRFYFSAIHRDYLSVYRFMYVMIACNLIQVYRDGLISLVIFTVVNMMPLVAIAVLSYVSFRRRRTRYLLQLQVAPHPARTISRG